MRRENESKFFFPNKQKTTNEKKWSMSECDMKNKTCTGCEKNEVMQKYEPLFMYEILFKLFSNVYVEKCEKKLFHFQLFCFLSAFDRTCRNTSDS